MQDKLNQQHYEQDVEREKQLNAMRLRLGLTQSSMCRLLVDKAQKSDYRLAERMVTPPRSLHSLVARARAEDRSGPLPQRAAASPRPTTPFGGPGR